jgi:hypothetical protein
VKVDGGTDVKTRAFFTSAQDAGEWAGSRSDRSSLGNMFMAPTYMYECQNNPPRLALRESFPAHCTTLCERTGTLSARQVE